MNRTANVIVSKPTCSTGGVFTITILHSSAADFTAQESILWDRKTDGGFPEVKRLKALVRNIVDPSRNLGHIDRANDAKTQGLRPAVEEKKKDGEEGAAGGVDGADAAGKGEASAQAQGREERVCEDC